MFYFAVIMSAVRQALVFAFWYLEKMLLVPSHIATPVSSSFNTPMYSPCLVYVFSFSGSLPALKTNQNGTLSRPSDIIIHLRKQVSTSVPECK